MQTLHILFPFQGKHRLFFFIAILTAGNEVILGAAASTGQGEEVVHGQIFERDFSSTEMTLAGSGPLLPPATFPELSGLILFPAQFRLINTVKLKEVTHIIFPRSLALASPIRYTEPAIQIRSLRPASSAAFASAASREFSQITRS
mgnify:CR=1 FL=1